MSVPFEAAETRALAVFSRRIDSSDTLQLTARQLPNAWRFSADADQYYDVLIRYRDASAFFVDSSLSDEAASRLAEAFDASTQVSARPARAPQRVRLSVLLALWTWYLVLLQVALVLSWSSSSKSHGPVTGAVVLGVLLVALVVPTYAVIRRR